MTFEDKCFWLGFVIGAVFMGITWSLSAYAFDNPQMDKSHCAPGVQGRCIEIKPPNPCGERK